MARTGSTLTGAIRGTTVSGGSGTPRPDGGYVGVGRHRFVGSVEGCSEGTLAWSEEIVSTDGTTVSGTWRVVDGSGTGGLARVAGGGTFEGTTGPDGSGTVTAEGVLACGG